MGELFDKLQKNKESDMYPFHMPGHKRNTDFGGAMCGHDITEISGFDDLHNPKDVIKRLSDRISYAYGAGKSYILVNGSTSGIQIAIFAATQYGDTIIMARNSHKAAYNAAYLRQLNIEYLYTKHSECSGISGAIDVNDVDKLLCENPKAKAVFITSPTYEGVVSDVESIARIVHKHNALLIVDSAHGAHLGVLDSIPNPVTQGADYVIMSLHKTLPCFTQTAVLCDNTKGKLIQKYFDIFISSSPSYLMMESIEKCFDIIENQGEKVYNKYIKMLNSFREECKKLEKLYLYTWEGCYDSGKIVICTDRCNINGNDLAKILRDKYNLELEMAEGNYALAMTSMCDTQEGFDRLKKALFEVDITLNICSKKSRPITYDIEKKYEIHKVDNIESEWVKYKDAINRIAKDYIYVYPPGVPWVVPGEVIPRDFSQRLEEYIEAGFEIRGLEENKINVLLEKCNG